MKKIVIFSQLFLFILGCAPQEGSDIVLKNTQRHTFSNSQHPDEFKLTLQGDSILQSKMHFTIKTYHGKVIYSETEPSTALLGYGLMAMSENPSDEDRIKYIKKRVSEFFSENNFVTPAINQKMKFDPDMHKNKPLWKELKSDPKSVGFGYITYEENGQHIAYSKKLKKVMVYLSCC